MFSPGGGEVAAGSAEEGGGLGVFHLVVDALEQTAGFQSGELASAGRGEVHSCPRL